jgi:ATP-dependent helicase/nuclease subunit A
MIPATMMEIAEMLREPPMDSAERQEALDIRHSVIVQAPAGSGKTDLLTRRYLRLLASVDEPEEILAITFTRAATAEMRARVLRDLEAAAGRRTPGNDDVERLVLARAALAHAERRAWNIFEHSQRLAIETIDSLCLRIAHDRPLLARLGGSFEPIEEADALYDLAARRTLERLGGPDPALDEALAQLLDLRDNRLSDCASLIAEMLKTRDQWVSTFPLSEAMSEDDWDDLRGNLEKPFHRENGRVLAEAFRLLTSQPAVEQQLLELAAYAARHGNEQAALLDGVSELTPDMPIEHWRAICDFVLTTGKQWRKSVNVRQGFPSSGHEARERKRAMEELLLWLQHTPHLLEALCAIRRLPPEHYSGEQWATLRNVFTVLRQAVAELKVIFAERNQVDFTELSLSASYVLQRSPERVLDIAGNVRHLLIDEFQDTSRRQHELVSALLAAWDPGEGRTVFLVGDPMQSIYMFRQAEVELFTRVREHGIGQEAGHIRCHPVQLSVNFRSHRGLTEPLNGIFDVICAEEVAPGSASVPFARATSPESPLPAQGGFHIHPRIIGNPDRNPTLVEIAAAQLQEAEAVLGIVEQHLPRIQQARDTGAEYRVAILVRARSHLAQIVPLLRKRGIAFRAVEIEHLSERQELLDLRALTHALLHPMNRIAWLSVLRAPWCGLTLSDLHLLTGADDPTLRNRSIAELIEDRGHLLTEDGQRRLARTADVMRGAQNLRWRQSESPSFASWVERTWRTLGGPAFLDATACENAQVFFALLDAVAADGLDASTASFDAEFERLFAHPDPGVSERAGIQLMTIHKAKGLGFDVVIVPGLDRRSSGDPNPLVCSLERMNPWTGENEILVAPIGLHGEDTEPLYKWVRKQRQIRFDEERKRLFYVACTRARLELHLLGTAAVSPTGVRAQNQDSLLATAWSALHARFEEAAREPQTAAAPRVIAFPGQIREMAAVEEPAPLILRRLPLATLEATSAAHEIDRAPSPAIDSNAPLFQRAEGSRESRLIGSIVHMFIERIGPDLARMDTADLQVRVGAVLRASAVTGESLRNVTDTVVRILTACAADPVCRWIAADHPEAQSEASWTGFLGSGSASLRTLRADRVFRAGPAPLDSSSSDFLWVVDYKTAESVGSPLLLASERGRHEAQLVAYARALRAVHGAVTNFRLGLYYTSIPALDWWEPEEL